MSYREKEGKQLRVLFCIGVQHPFFEEEGARVASIAAAIKEAFANLSDRFGLTVLGTMDDDELMVGSSIGWPWTAYVLADAPDLESVAAVCNIVRESSIGEHRLWRYLRIEARVGRELFFANE